VLSSAVIVFREVLEAALIISIVMAATRGLLNRGWWVVAGILAGLGGAIAVAISAEHIAASFEGMGQETFNAIVLLLAVLMLAWHNIWMAQHGKELSARMTAIGNNVSIGEAPMYALTFAISMAVLREGSEVVLFLSGISASGQDASNLIGGSLLGIGTGTLAGYFLYTGLVQIPLKQFFNATSWMILLLAAGLSAGAAGFLEQAGWVPALAYDVWDTSSVLSEKSIAGQLLHTLIGYQEKPSGIQLVFYFVTLVVTYLLMQFIGSRNSIPSKNTAVI